MIGRCAVRGPGAGNGLEYGGVPSSLQRGHG